MDNSYWKSEEVSGWNADIQEHAEKYTFDTHLGLCQSEEGECIYVNTQ